MQTTALHNPRKQKQIKNSFVFTPKSTGEEAARKQIGISSVWANMMKKCNASWKDESETHQGEDDFPSENFKIFISLKKVDPKIAKKLKKAKKAPKTSGRHKKIAAYDSQDYFQGWPLNQHKYKSSKQAQVFKKTKQKEPLRNLIKREFTINIEEITNDKQEQEKLCLQNELFLCDSNELDHWEDPDAQEAPRTQKQNLSKVNFSIQMGDFEEKEVRNSQPNEECDLIVLDSPPVQPTAPPQPSIQIVESIPKPTQQVDDVILVRKYLGKLPLRDLVIQLRLKLLISESLYREFLDFHRFEMVRCFIRRFHAGKLHHFDFERQKFTLLDHRRICELLTNLYPTQYEIGEPTSFYRDVQEFLTKMYDLSGEDYYKLYTKIDNISKIKWWGKILLSQEERLASCFKEKRVNQRRAERAETAVDEFINAFKKKNGEGGENQENRKRLKDF